MSVNGKNLSGNEVRTKLGLKSTWFTWQVDKDKIIFSTRGYGHGAECASMVPTVCQTRKEI